MDFELDDDQHEFAALARKFFEDRPILQAVRGQLDEPSAPVPGIGEYGELGFLGLLVPEDLGGLGRTVLDVAVVAEQAGRVLAAPSLSTIARASALLSEHPRQLADLCSGAAAFAVIDGSLTESEPVVDGLRADRFLAFDGADLLLGDAEVILSEPIDPSRGLARVRMTARSALGPHSAQAWEHAKDIAAVVMAAEDLGSAARAVELAVTYARDRMAFGRAIGSYQAIKHRLVDDWVAVEQLRSLVWWAAWTADAEPDRLQEAASAAKAYSARVLDGAAETVVQIHGAMGFTWEHDAHLYWRRAKVDRLLLGDEAFHLDRVAELALAERDAYGHVGRGVGR